MALKTEKFSDGSTFQYIEADVVQPTVYKTPQQKQADKRIALLVVSAAEVRKVRRETKARDEAKVSE